MQLNRPRIQKVIVTAHDREEGRSKSITLYSTTPEEVIEQLKTAVSGNEKSPQGRRRKRPST